MFTIKKIWNALNHAGKPWQIALAIAFGMIVGFTPLLSLHNIIILFVVLFLNVHIGIFVLATSLFSIIGLALDPLFNSLGMSVLTADVFNSFFTQMYNNPIGYLSGFNNTILMGSFIVSIVLFIFVYKLTSIILVKYRVIIATKIKNIPLLNKLQFFQNEDVRQVKTFRILGIIVFSFLIAGVLLFKIFLFDPILKANLETTINKSSDKIVNIGNLSTSILNSSIVLEDLVIQDKKDITQNVQIENITLEVRLSELVFKRILVENLTIEKISFPNRVHDIVQKEEQKASTVKVNNKSDKLNNLESLNSLNTINTLDITKNMNQNYTKEFEQYKEFYNKIKPLFNSEKNLEQKRADGEYVYFNLDANKPDILIKKGIFSVIIDDNNIKGTFQDFTTNQYLYKKPFKISINTQSDRFKNLILDLSILETKEKSLDILNLKVTQLKLKPLIQKNISINNAILTSTLDLKIIDKKLLTGHQTIDVLSTDIAFDNTNKYIEILNKSLLNIKEIKAKISILGTLQKPKLDIDSNIDNILKSKLKSVLNSQKDTIKNELKEKIKEKIEKKAKDKVKDKLKGILGF